MQVSAWSGRIALETYNSGNRFINFSTSVRCAMAQLTHIQTGKCHFHYFLATLLLQKNRLTPSKLILSQSVGAIFTPSFKALTSSSTSSKSIWKILPTPPLALHLLLSVDKYSPLKQVSVIYAWLCALQVCNVQLNKEIQHLFWCDTVQSKSTSSK